jgi:hypothetical protein
LALPLARHVSAHGSSAQLAAQAKISAQVSAAALPAPPSLGLEDVVVVHPTSEDAKSAVMNAGR